MIKHYKGKAASFAAGGPVTETDSRFLKTPDKFRDAQYKSTVDPTEYGKGEAGAKKSAPAAKTKSLTPVKPRG